MSHARLLCAGPYQCHRHLLESNDLSVTASIQPWPEAEGYGSWLVCRRRGFCFVFQAGVFLGQVGYGVVAFVDVELEPVAFDSLFGDSYSGGEAATMVAPGAVTRHEGRHQAVGQAAFRLFIGPSHGEDDILAG